MNSKFQSHHNKQFPCLVHSSISNQVLLAARVEGDEGNPKYHITRVQGDDIGKSWIANQKTFDETYTFLPKGCTITLTN